MRKLSIAGHPRLRLGTFPMARASGVVLTIYETLIEQSSNMSYSKKKKSSEPDNILWSDFSLPSVRDTPPETETPDNITSIHCSSSTRG